MKNEHDFCANLTSAVSSLGRYLDLEEETVGRMSDRFLRASQYEWHLHRWQPLQHSRAIVSLIFTALFFFQRGPEYYLI